MKWSLRTIFLMIAIIAAALAWRSNVRGRLADAAERIKAMGAEVSHRAERPTVTQVSVTITPYNVSLGHRNIVYADGTSVTVWPGIQVLVFTNTIKVSSPAQNRGVLNCLSNEDVIVEAIQVNESDVDEIFVEALCELDGLKVILIQRDREYFRVKVCNSKRDNVEPNRLMKMRDELGEPMEKALALIQAKLPDVKIVEGIAN